MVSKITDNPAIAKSLRRLRNMGLKCTVEQINDNWIFIVCTEESIINTIKRIVDKNIGYSKHYVEYDKRTGMLIIHFWRGEKPKGILLKEMRGDNR